MSFSAYVICTTPRSGSTLLCDMLTASGVAGEPHSYFRPQDIGYWAELWKIGCERDVTDPQFNMAYLSAMMRTATAESGIFGLRLMWRSVDEASNRLNAAFGGYADVKTRLEQAFGRTLLIHLSRLDKVAQAISLVRAEQTGLWHVAADGTERERTAPAEIPIFDARRIRQTRDDLASDERAWACFFDRRGIAPMRLTYEDLATDPRLVLADILGALGCDPTDALRVSAKTARMADTASSEWAGRLKQ